MARKWLGVTYQNFPRCYETGGRANYDLGSIENPTAQAVCVDAVFASAEEADAWFEGRGRTNCATFALSSLRAYGQAVYARAVRIARDVAEEHR